MTAFSILAARYQSANGCWDGTEQATIQTSAQRTSGKSYSCETFMLTQTQGWGELPTFANGLTDRSPVVESRFKTVPVVDVSPGLNLPQLPSSVRLGGSFCCFERAVRYRVPLHQKPEGLSWEYRIAGAGCDKAITSPAGLPLSKSSSRDGEEGGVLLQGALGVWCVNTYRLYD